MMGYLCSAEEPIEVRCQRRGIHIAWNGKRQLMFCGAHFRVWIQTRGKMPPIACHSPEVANAT